MCRLGISELHGLGRGFGKRWPQVLEDIRRNGLKLKLRAAQIHLEFDPATDYLRRVAISGHEAESRQLAAAGMIVLDPPTAGGRFSAIKD